MRAFQRSVIFGVSLLLSACGNLQAVKLAEVPPGMRSTQLHLSAIRPSKEEVATGAWATAYEVPGHSVFLNQTSGGSVLVGLAFGWLGHLANAANIARITNEMGKSGESSSHYELDALQEAAAAWGTATESDIPPSSQGVHLKPFLVLYVPDGKPTVYTIVGVRVEAARQPEQSAAPAWVGQYQYALHTTFTVDALQKPLPSEQRAAYQHAIREGYQQIRGELLRDLSSDPPPARLIAWVNAPVLGPVGVPGDIEKNQTGRLALRVNMDNYTAFVEKLASYMVWIFPSVDQYHFDNGPVERRKE